MVYIVRSEHLEPKVLETEKSELKDTVQVRCCKQVKQILTALRVGETM